MRGALLISGFSLLLVAVLVLVVLLVPGADAQSQGEPVVTAGADSVTVDLGSDAGTVWLHRGASSAGLSVSCAYVTGSHTFTGLVSNTVYTWSVSNTDVNYCSFFQRGPDASGQVTLGSVPPTATPVPTATPTATVEPTPTATPVPTARALPSEVSEVSGVVHCDGRLALWDEPVSAFALVRVRFYSGGSDVVVLDLSGMCGDPDEAGLVYLAMPWESQWLTTRDVVFFVRGGRSLETEGVSWSQEDQLDGDHISRGVFPAVGDEGVEDFLRTWWQQTYGRVSGVTPEESVAIMAKFHPALAYVLGDGELFFGVSGGDVELGDGGGDGPWAESVGLGGVSILIIGAVVLGIVVYKFAGGRKPVVAAVLVLGASLGIGAETGVITEGVVYVYGGVCVVIVSAALFRRIGWGGS